ncbi:BON domain-containing protein [Variovorax ginsengisoli]|uniref:BON domain-containing protein n=1 Tax=Variovorax ginsengisoli TaxID=363844 RepID=A0ABT8S7G4_9BURK|nr:BON domain-containing protein [Variovorax ginsengisoli]MDN8614176.1 BON domain-containing protein [Variovorax ginsengisoli]MDO1533346.1 BON domain-containing protein [Variovorax ginsengisoli]
MSKRWISRLAAASCILGLIACTERAGDSTGKRADAVGQAEKAAAAAGNKAAEMAELARDKTRAFITSPEVRQDAAAVGSAIKNAGNAAVSTVDDAAITASVSRVLAKDPALDAGRIEVETRAGVVHLAGHAPSAAAKARAGELAGGVQGVSAVDNALEVQAL